jgi:hypothetical protein
VKGRRRRRWQLLEVAFIPRTERWQGMMGEVFEVAGQCRRSVSAINCGVGGYGWVGLV